MSPFIRSANALSLSSARTWSSAASVAERSSRPSQAWARNSHAWAEPVPDPVTVSKAPRAVAKSPFCSAEMPRPASAQATAFLHDQMVRLVFDFVSEVLDAPVTGISLVGLGGTGRGEMAPGSDLDLMVLTAKAPGPNEERAAEAILHLLWDLKIKVGH